MGNFFVTDGSDSSCFLSDDAQMYMLKAVEIINDTMEKLCSGTISMETCKMIQQHQDNFRAICQIINRRQASKTATNDAAISNALVKRMQQVTLLEGKRSLLQNFYNHCQALSDGKANSITVIVDNRQAGSIILCKCDNIVILN